MLTPERHHHILSLLRKQNIATIHEFVEVTNSSESTIRRDLITLEQSGKLIRFHGGAKAVNVKSEETSISERIHQFSNEKNVIAKYAASLVQNGDCIFLDAGSTTFNMIPFLPKNIIIVTNGLNFIDYCLEHELKTFLLGGEVKAVTRALIGKGAFDAMKSYRFDKSFIGMNSIHPTFGLTTPDPDEALIKRTAIELSNESYVLVDQSKFGKVSFAHVADLNMATIITNSTNDIADTQSYQKQTTVKVVSQ